MAQAAGCRRRGTVMLAALGAAVVTTVLASADAQANCQDLLGSRIYRCQIKPDTTERFVDCFQFINPGTQSEDFDLFSDVFIGLLSCDCKSRGGFADPGFGESNSFHCVSKSDAAFGLAFEGAVKRQGRRLTGQAVNDSGISFVFRCDRARACELPLSTQGAPKASW